MALGIGRRKPGTNAISVSASQWLVRRFAVRRLTHNKNAAEGSSIASNDALGDVAIARRREIEPRVQNEQRGARICEQDKDGPLAPGRPRSQQQQRDLRNIETHPRDVPVIRDVVTRKTRGEVHNPQRLEESADGQSGHQWFTLHFGGRRPLREVTVALAPSVRTAGQLTS